MTIRMNGRNDDDHHGDEDDDDDEDHQDDGDGTSGGTCWPLARVSVAAAHYFHASCKQSSSSSSTWLSSWLSSSLLLSLTLSSSPSQSVSVSSSSKKSHFSPTVVHCFQFHPQMGLFVNNQHHHPKYRIRKNTFIMTMMISWCLGFPRQSQTWVTFSLSILGTTTTRVFTQLWSDLRDLLALRCLIRITTWPHQPTYLDMGSWDSIDNLCYVLYVGWRCERRVGMIKQYF